MTTANNTTPTPQFTYTTAKVSDFKLLHKHDRKTRQPSVMEIEGVAAQATGRFWNSLYSLYGFNDAFFRYFTHDEVFNRIQATNDREVRVCIETNPNTQQSTLLACTNPTKGIIEYDEASGLLTDLGATKQGYGNGTGIVSSTHRPMFNNNPFTIGGDEFTPMIELITPIDGYGLPSIYISVLRQVCSNGMIGYAKAFRQQINLGKKDPNVAYCIQRHLQNFNNDEGFVAIRNRLESAQKSPASLYETENLQKLIYNLDLHSDLVTNMGSFTNASSLRGDSSLYSKYRNLTGDVAQLYGLATAAVISDKKLRTLPAKQGCTVYDLINFATEISSHHATPNGSRKLGAWLGTLLTNEYDLEGTSTTTKSEFTDLFLSA